MCLFTFRHVAKIQVSSRSKLLNIRKMRSVAKSQLHFEKIEFSPEYDSKSGGVAKLEHRNRFITKTAHAHVPRFRIPTLEREGGRQTMRAYCVAAPADGKCVRSITYTRIMAKVRYG